MFIILKKGVDCGHLGYLPPETEIVLPADSAALGERWVGLGYATDAGPFAYEVVPPPSWASSGTIETFADGTGTHDMVHRWISDTTDEAADE